MFVNTEHGLLNIIYIKNEVKFLLEIGEEFKEKRKEIGVSLDEASSDLKIDKILLDNLESGNSRAFKDILELKDVILLYSKYLGLDSDKMFDDLNDYFFEMTSKINTEDINDLREKIKKEDKKIKSPYTLEVLKERNPRKVVIIISIIIIVILFLFWIILNKVMVG